MDDDIVARLSKALETQSVNLTDEEGNSTHDIINKLSQQINDLHDEAGGDDYTLDQLDDYEDEPVVELPNRPTPYEVWKTKHEVKKMEKKPKVMKDGDWDNLVGRLHGTKRTKESTIKQQQNRELAEQLRELSFKPTLNEKSAKMAENLKRGPMIHRVKKDMEVREKKLADELKKKKQEELDSMNTRRQKGVLFQKGNGNGSAGFDRRPVRSDDKKNDSRKPTQMTYQAHMKKNEKILKQGNKASRRTIEDIVQYGEETKLRRLQRKQIMEELDNRELTFTPQLNRASLLLQEKMRREGRAMYCKTSGQTETRQKVVKGGSGTKEDPGHEEEVFHPRISARAASYKSPDGKNVHARLYEHAHNQAVEKHNQQVQLMTKYYHTNTDGRTGHKNGISLKANEMTERVKGADSATWVRERKAKAKSQGQSSTVNVIEYDKSLNFILAPMTVIEYDKNLNFMLNQS